MSRERLKDARESIELARLLNSRVGLRDETARQQIKDQIQLAKSQLELFEQDIEMVEELRSGDTEQ